MKEQLGTRNEYGVRDLTPYNAANRMSGSRAGISFGGDVYKRQALAMVATGCQKGIWWSTWR